MSNKEEKFWEELRYYVGSICEAGEVAGAWMAGGMTQRNGIETITQTKRSCREQKDVLLTKMCKAYKEPSALAAAQALVEKSYHIIDQLKSLVQLLDTVQVGRPPQEMDPLVELMKESLQEMKKVMDYTVDRKANAMKMEARCHRIYTYEERGDGYRKEALQYLYGQNQDPMVLLYWKDVLDQLEQILDSTAGMVAPLQRLATGL